jgi:hypothetical protein
MLTDLTALLLRTSVVGHGCSEGCLDENKAAEIVAEALAALNVDGKRVLVLIPDGTRTMPMAQMFGLLEQHLGPRFPSL